MFEPHAKAPSPACLRERDMLNLGCGRKYSPEAVNLDITSDVSPDVVHDLNVRPWPFPDGHFREVSAYDVIEHLNDVVAIMEEIHRVCRHGAIVRITVPHFSCANAFADITHRHHFGWSSFDFATGAHDLSFYTRRRFRRRHAQIVFYPTVVNKLVWRLANRYPAAYERRWAWIFPAWYLYYELEVMKDTNSDVHENAVNT